MKINIPFMPISVDVRVRRLPPLRFSMLHLMIAVAFFGLLFGLMNQLGKRDRAWNYHNAKAREAGDSSKAGQWHLKQMLALQQSHEFIDSLTFLMISASEFLGVVIVLGRVLDLLLRRFSTDDGHSHSLTPNLNPEGPRP